MRKIKFILLIVFSILLTACGQQNLQDLDEYSNLLKKPNKKFELSGIWENTEIYDIADKKKEKVDKSNELFISNKVFDFNSNYIIEPNISSRYVNFFSYMRPKITEIPDEYLIKNDTTTIYKFSNNISFSQEFVEIDKDKLITIYLGKIYVYEKKSKVTEKEINEKHAQLESIMDGNKNIVNNDYGLAISFRARNINISNSFDYNYYTYYMKKGTKDEKSAILKVNDIVIPNNSGLWTIKSTKHQDANGKNIYSISANPEFMKNKEGTNIISDNTYRRIDYVNREYIGVTNFNYTNDSVYESYNIYQLSKLGGNNALNATNIAGNAGNEIYLTSYKENLNLLSAREDIDIVEFTPDPKNIGIKRIANGWKFRSSIDLQSQKNSGGLVTSPFDLDFTPTVNIAQTEKSMFTWREILARRPGAIDATISPDKNYILIQSSNSIELYPVYFNYIGNKPLFTIQNVNNYEIVMIQWVNDESIDSLYQEYLKLPKLNSYILYQ